MFLFVVVLLVCLFVCLFGCLFVCLFVCLFARSFDRSFVCLVGCSFFSFVLCLLPRLPRQMLLIVSDSLPFACDCCMKYLPASSSPSNWIRRTGPEARAG